MSRSTTIVTEEIKGLPARITQLREERHLSKKQLADTLHVSPSAISSYELGERLPSLDMIVKMSYFFNVSCDFLLGIRNAEKRELSENLSPEQKSAIIRLLSAFHDEKR